MIAFFYKHMIYAFIPSITIQYNVQRFQHPLPRLSVLRAQPQRVASHPSQRLQARGCARARRGVCHGILLHFGLRERASRLALRRDATRPALIIYYCNDHAIIN